MTSQSSLPLTWTCSIKNGNQLRRLGFFPNGYGRHIFAVTSEPHGLTDKRGLIPPKWEKCLQRPYVFELSTANWQMPIPKRRRCWDQYGVAANLNSTILSRCEHGVRRYMNDLRRWLARIKSGCPGCVN